MATNTMEFRIGTLQGDWKFGPPDIEVPEGFSLTEGYCVDPAWCNSRKADAANVHIAAAHGKFAKLFVPILLTDASSDKPAKSVDVTDVSVSQGRTLHRDHVWFGELTCVDSLSISVGTSDGRTFDSAVPMAVTTFTPDEGPFGLLVTPQARDDQYFGDIFYFLGGLWDEGDTEDTQQEQFEEELDAFWAAVDGPDEPLRRQIVRGLPKL